MGPVGGQVDLNVAIRVNAVSRGKRTTEAELVVVDVTKWMQ